MAARLPHASAKRISNEQLRSETAALLHDAFRGVTKMVAAELGVGVSRVYRQADAEDANYLELIYRQLDRAAREGNAEEVAEVLAWLVGQFGYSLAAHLPFAGELRVESAGGTAIEKAAHTAARIFEALSDEHLTDEERSEIARTARETAREFDRVAIAAAGIDVVSPS